MMLRILLVLVIACAIGLGGCKKKEPTLAEQADQMKQEAEKTADEAKDTAEKTVEETQKTAEEAAK